MILLDNLADSGVRHGFFTRAGGRSSGLYSSLNCGFGSGDGADTVDANRAIAMQRLGQRADRLVTCYQIHSDAVATVERPWPRQQAPRADAMVTRVPGLALGVLTADCAPVLFADAQAQVIGAAHAGWRGALGGVLEATLLRMEALGADRRRIRAGIGPCIGRHSYEVGPEFEEVFAAADPDNRGFFAPAARPGHFLFDLAGYVAHRLGAFGVGAIETVIGDTVADEARFFSYRRACLRAEAAYGRLLSAIALAG